MDSHTPTRHQLVMALALGAAAALGVATISKASVATQPGTAQLYTASTPITAVRPGMQMPAPVRRAPQGVPATGVAREPRALFAGRPSGSFVNAGQPASHPNGFQSGTVLISSLLVVLAAGVSYAVARVLSGSAACAVQQQQHSSYGSSSIAMLATAGEPDQETQKDVGIMVNSLKRTAYVPFVEERNPYITTISQFGGSPVLRHGETKMPSCGKCTKPMTLFLQVDLSEVPAAMHPTVGKEGVMQVFVCVNEGNKCTAEYKGAKQPPAPDAPLAYLIRVVPREEVIPAPLAMAGPSTTFEPMVITHWHPVEDYPRTVKELVAVYPHLATSTKLDAWDGTACVWGDKIGGWPMWTQDAEYQRCTECDCEMNATFQLDSDGNIDHAWGKGGCSYVHQCPQCGKYSFSWNERAL